MKKSIIIIFFLTLLILVGVYCIYNEIFNWEEFAEVFKYLIFRLPIGLLLLVLSKYNRSLEYNYKDALSYLGFVIGGILLLPPGIIYTLFIN